jgi:ATP-dependent DNA ligase
MPARNREDATDEVDQHPHSRRLLHGDRRVPVRFAVFDVLRIDDTDMASRRYAERRRLLEVLEFEASAWTTVPAFEDGEALWRVVCERRLEGIVAKRDASLYRPGRCSSWVKVKNPPYWRRDAEREAVSVQRMRTGRSVLSAPTTR